MTMIADRPTRRTASAASAAQRLRANFAATRVSFTWFGVRKTLSSEQKAQAAEQFEQLKAAARDRLGSQRRRLSNNPFVIPLLATYDSVTARTAPEFGRLRTGCESDD